jgi:hypothetical protein
MKRTTIFVPESLERDLQLYASRRKKPTAAVVREALAEYLSRRQATRTLPSFTGAFSSGRADTVDRHEEILFRKLAPHNSRPVARKSRAKRRQA